MKKILFFVILVSLTISTISQQVNWLSFEKAIELNKTNPKPILIDVYTDWCGWCKKMDKETYTNKVIVSYINTHLYAVKMDGEGKKDITYKDYTFAFKKEGNTKYHELAAVLMNGKLSYPTTLFMNEKNELVDRIPGYLETAVMEKVLVFFNEKKYETDSWEAFEKTFKSKL